MQVRGTLDTACSLYFMILYRARYVLHCSPSLCLSIARGEHCIDGKMGGRPPHHSSQKQVSISKGGKSTRKLRFNRAGAHWRTHAAAEDKEVCGWDAETYGEWSGMSGEEKGRAGVKVSFFPVQVEGMSTCFLFL